MNLIILFDKDFISADRVQLSDRRHQHILSIHRAQVGEQLNVGLLNGQLGHAMVESINRTNVTLAITLDKTPPTALALSLILALPRPKMLKRILQTCATMGVKDITLLNSYRVEKSYWQTPLLETNAIHEALILGLEQGKDTLLPNITIEKRFKPFVEDRLPALCQRTNDTLALVAHPSGTQTCPISVTQAVTLVVGPEGGFTPYEIEKLQAAGCQCVTLGERILRVETAIPVLLARLFT